jgi:hypothetical protein
MKNNGFVLRPVLFVSPPGLSCHLAGMLSGLYDQSDPSDLSDLSDYRLRSEPYSDL